MTSHPVTDSNGKLIGFKTVPKIRNRKRNRIQETSREAYHEVVNERKTQEGLLLTLYREHPEGLNDREVAALMNWTPAHASARRNGLIEQLATTRFEIVKLHRGKDGHTRKIVWFWGIRERRPATEKQGSLFNE